jgi:hypothetical protein
MPEPLPAHLTTPQSVMRLLFMLGYPRDEIVTTIANQFDISTKDAEDVYAIISENRLSIEDECGDPETP